MNIRHLLWMLLLCWVETLGATMCRVDDPYTVLVSSQGFTSHVYPDSGADTLVPGLTSAIVPEVDIVAADSAVCLGDSMTLTAIITNAEEVSIIQPLPVAVGDILCTDSSIVKPIDFSGSGKTAEGIVFYVDSTGAHGWVAGLQDVIAEWCSEADTFDVPGLPNIEILTLACMDMDGYANTQALRSAGDTNMFPAAWAVDFENGWYVPALGQISLLFAYLPVINASLQVVGGSIFDMNDLWFYWSSTEYSATGVWNLVYGGQLRVDYKYAVEQVRAVKNF